MESSEPDQIILTEAEATKSVEEKIIVYPQSGTTLANDKAFYGETTPGILRFQAQCLLALAPRD